jgi:hypothetical protein
VPLTSVAHFLWIPKSRDGRGEPEVLPGEAMVLVVEGTGTTRECEFYFVAVELELGLS